MKNISIFIFTIVLSISFTKKSEASIWDGDAAMLAAQISTQVQVAAGVYQQIQNVKNTAEQLKFAVKNAQQLDPTQIAQLQGAYYNLDAVYRQSRGLGMQWGGIAAKYDKKYEAYDPKIHNEATYEKKRKEWASETDDSIRAAMLSHGVISSYKKRYADIDAMLAASRGATGQLQAIQAATEISGILAKQLTELTQLIVVDSRARMTFLKEKIAKEEAAKKHTKTKKMMRNYNKKKTRAPVVKKKFDRIK